MTEEYLRKVAQCGLAALTIAASGAAYAADKVDLDKLDSPALKQSIENVVNDYKVRTTEDGGYLIAGPCSFGAGGFIKA